MSMRRHKKAAEHISQEKHAAVDYVLPLSKQLTVKRGEKKQKSGVQNEQSMINRES